MGASDIVGWQGKHVRLRSILTQFKTWLQHLKFAA